MTVSVRYKLLAATAIPVVLLFGAMASILVATLGSRSVRRLEAGEIERVAMLAELIEDTLADAPGAASDARTISAAGRRAALAAGADRSIALVGADGTILFTSLPGPGVPRGNLAELLRRAGRADLVALAERIGGPAAGVARVPGVLTPEPRWISYAPVPAVGGALITVLPESVGLAFQRQQLAAGFAILSVGLALVLAAVVLAGRVITRPIGRLAAAVAALGRGDLGARIGEIRSRDEIGDLARAFDRMVSDLSRHVDALAKETAAREAAERELAVGRRLQEALLPRTFPSTAEVDLHARNLAARHVAGDFYDAFEDARGRIVVLVADVSGKGLGAALFMAIARTVLRAQLARSVSLETAVASASDALEAEGISAMYLTAFVAALDPGTGEVTYVNAGHPQPWRLRPSAPPVPFGEVTGGPVGLLPGRRFEGRADRIERGERLVIVTDGVPEARDRTGEFYGDERAAAVLRDARPEESAAATCERLIDAVAAFQAGELADDLTVMTVARRG